MLAIAAAGCGGGDDDRSMPANLAVRQRVEALAPAANLAHRGTGPNRPLSRFPENSLAAYREAIAQGADGIELDVELTADLELLVLHDDRLDRTTTCTGCLSAYTFAAARACRLVDGRRQPSDEPMPTLAEAYAVLPLDALVNVELKVYGGECLTAGTGGDVLARRAAAEVRRLGAARRTLFSSFDADAVVALRHAHPDLYAALLTYSARPADLEQVAALGLDAIHPFYTGASAADVAAARALGLQVNLWTVNSRAFLEQALAKQPSAIITDEPGVLAEIIGISR